MRSSTAALAVALIALGVSATAEARAVHYRSQHPLPRKIGHGFCYINVPHVHDFGPSDPRLYREVNGEYYFVGDPAPFEYEGPRYSFYGPHPVVDAEVQFGQPVYCYLNGPHFHGYQPPPQAQFEFRGGAYWFVGNYDPSYYQDRPRYAAVNQAYQPIAYTRPVVDVTVAPPSFHGEIVVAGYPPGVGGYPRAQAVVGGPVVSAGVTVGVPAPPPIQVGIGIGFVGGGPPPPPVVVERREVYEIHEPSEHERHEHHDNGRHNGWNKHEHEEHGWREPPHQEPPHAGGWRPAPAAPPPPSGGWRGGATPPPQQQHHEKHDQHGSAWHR